MSESSSLDRALRSAVAAARAAGEVLVLGFSAPDKEARTKGHPYNPVTIYDHRAEKAIVGILATEHPGDGILSEESPESAGTSGRRWIVDPLDGTSNFLAGIPQFAVSVALAVGEEIAVGCVHDPVRDETFTAVRGAGTHLNGRSIQVSRRATLDGAVLGVGLSFHPERRAEMLGQLSPILPRAGVLRTLGSAALDFAYVAGARYDAVWYLALDPWDVAAGGLLIEEAGGRLTNLVGAPMLDPRLGVVASNGRLHDGFLDALA
jgi:myo-inositol-1(or 4)-monophosphatase